MRLRVYGTFLITGQTVPMDEDLREQVERSVGTAIRPLGGHRVHATVTVAEMIGSTGGIHHRCRVSVRHRNAGKSVATGTGVSARDAVADALRQLKQLVAHESGPESLFCSPAA